MAMTALVNLFAAEVLTNIHSFIIVVPNHAGEDVYRFKTPVKVRVCVCVCVCVSTRLSGCLSVKVCMSTFLSLVHPCALGPLRALVRRASTWTP